MGYGGNRRSSTRREASEEARRILERRPLFFDTETTGLESRDEIIEIGIVESEGTVLFESLVKPTRRIPASASRIHGIRDEDVADAPVWSILWPQIESIFQNRTVAIYNAEYDLRLLSQTHRAHRLPATPAGARANCVMKLYAKYRGEPGRRAGDYRWHSLANAGSQCRIPLANRHRAVDDALLTRAVLNYMAQNP